MIIQLHFWPYQIIVHWISEIFTGNLNASKGRNLLIGHPKSSLETWKLQWVEIYSSDTPRSTGKILEWCNGSFLVQFLASRALLKYFQCRHWLVAPILNSNKSSYLYITRQRVVTKVRFWCFFHFLRKHLWAKFYTWNKYLKYQYQELERILNKFIWKICLTLLAIR